MKIIATKITLVCSIAFFNTVCLAKNPGGASQSQLAQIKLNTANIEALQGSNTPSLGSDLTSTEGGTVACTKASGGSANLIISSSDDSTGTVWAKALYQSTETTFPYANSYINGALNTDTIVSQNGTGTDYAAGICKSLSQGTKTDWHLPSIGELTCLHRNWGIINKSTGAMNQSKYWSSTEYAGDPSTQARMIHFTNDPSLKKGNKDSEYGVRCVRTFTP